MRCKDIERLLIDSSEGELNAEELSQVKQHIKHCSNCAQLEDDLKNIRISIKKMARPESPAELLRQTQLICHAEIRALKSGVAKFSRQNHFRIIPTPVWAALISLIALTVILLIPLLTKFNLEPPLSIETIVVLTLMIQNAAMLFFAPVLIRKYRSRDRSLRLG